MSIFEYIFCKLKNQKGEISMWAVFGGLLLIIAYLLYPEPFHNFVKYILDTVFDVLHESFGTEDKEDFGSSGTKKVTPGEK